MLQRMPAAAHRVPRIVTAALALLAVTAACTSIRRDASAPSRLELDPELSPAPFRWLADDAVLVAPTLGERKLAGFGNFVARAARRRDQARLSVWDDEKAWKLASSGRDSDDEVLAHRRAEYLKDVSPSESADRFLVFNRDGEVVYQRDFRSWPLSELD